MTHGPTWFIKCYISLEQTTGDLLGPSEFRLKEYQIFDSLDSSEDPPNLSSSCILKMFKIYQLMNIGDKQMICVSLLTLVFLKVHDWLPRGI